MGEILLQLKETKKKHEKTCNFTPLPLVLETSTINSAIKDVDCFTEGLQNHLAYQTAQVSMFYVRISYTCQKLPPYTSTI